MSQSPRPLFYFGLSLMGVGLIVAWVPYFVGWDRWVTFAGIGVMIIGRLLLRRPTSSK